MVSLRTTARFLTLPANESRLLVRPYILYRHFSFGLALEYRSWVMHMMWCLLKYVEIRTSSTEIHSWTCMEYFYSSFVGGTTLGVERLGMGQLGWFDVN